MEQYPDLNQLMALARSPVGQQLLSALKHTDPEAAKKAASLASGGNMEQAKAAISNLLANEDIQKLLRQLEQKP